MLRSASLVLAALLLAPVPAALAKEESKIQIRLETPTGSGPGNGNGVGKGAVRGDVRTHLQGSKVILQLRVRGLEPDAGYALLCLDGEADPEPALLFSFETGGSGSANLTHDLSKGDDPEAPRDPRGKLLQVVDADDDEILSGWLYGDPADDGPHTKVKERTRLAPDPDADPAGQVEASYRTLPNGRSSLSVATRHIPQGDYELFVDGALVAEFSPNPAGNAKLDFRTRPGKGKGPKKVKPHRKKQQLSFDPRRKLIEVRLDDGTLLFSGPMIAQVQGLNVCAESSAQSPLSGASGSGELSRELESDCETALDVFVMDVAAGPYDVYVDGALVGGFEAVDDAGSVTGGVRFDPTPDDPDEELLDFAIDSGLPVEIFAGGADPDVDVPVLTGSLP